MTTDEVRFFGVPHRLTLDDGFVIRRYDEDDMPAVVDVVNANLEHLSPWMPWAQEPMTLDGQLTFLRETDKQWDEGTNFVYGIFDPTGRVVGGTGFHVRNGAGVLEIGYWLARDAGGKGLMTRVEIHCDADNVRSAAIPKRLGYSLVRVDEREVAAPAETGKLLIFALDL
jgi:RimJ/RimL family protein N-acetyltransferase